MIWMRFKLKNKDNEQALLELLVSKNITRDDLLLILSTLELRDYIQK